MTVTAAETARGSFQLQALPQFWQEAAVRIAQIAELPQQITRELHLRPGVRQMEMDSSFPPGSRAVLSLARAA